MTSQKNRPSIRMNSLLSLSKLHLTASLLFCSVFSVLNGQQFSMEVPNADEGVYLKSVDVSVEIVGSFAMTTAELIFHNPNGRQLEGTLEFPLLDGQSIVRFAMDVNGSLREAVPVEKAKGQAVFEEIERRRVDPGLLEKTQGNHYRARIFPLLPNSDKRVVIATMEDLSAQSAAPTYRLAMNYGELKTLNIQLAMKGIEAGPQVKKQGIDGVEFSDWSKDWVSSASAVDVVANGLIEIVLPQAPSRQAVTQEIGGKHYFYFPLTLPAIHAKRLDDPKRVNIIWDSSSSSASQDFTKIYAFLDRLFSTHQNLQVILTRVRDQVDAPLQFSIDGAEWGSLKNELQSTIYDGATLRGLAIAATEDDLTLLISDGLQNWGSAPLSKSINTRLFSISTSTSADPALLRAVAQKNGGDLINLLKTDAKTAVEKLTEPSTLLESLSYNPQQLSLLSLEAGAVISSGGGIAGILRSETAELVLELRTADGKVRAQTIHLSQSDEKSQSSFAGRIWANKRIETLELEPEKNALEIQRLGKAFGIVTKGTSLIILDTVEDYARYEITPPDDLKTAYLSLMRDRRNEELVGKQGHLDSVFQLWQNEIAWYQKDWPKDAMQKQKLTSKQRERAVGAIAERRSEAAPAMEMQLSAGEEVYELDAFETASDSSTAAMPDQESRDVVFSMGNPSPEPNAHHSGRSSVSIALQPWKPDSAYAEQISKKEGDACYRTYLELKPEYARSTAFYLDCFDILNDKGLKSLALRVLSNLAEMNLENHSILRILGYRLMQVDQDALAVPVFETVMRIRPEEPQSYRDMALVQHALGKDQAAIGQYWKIVSQPWDARFPEVEIVALHELNAIVATSSEDLDLTQIDSRFIKSMPMHLRVVLTWDADNTDIDLWVTDPNGETCVYSNPLTYQGGKMSRDFTQGYGPETFSLKNAKPGTYKVEANYYGNRQGIISGSTTLQLNLQTHFGTPEKEEQTVTLRLKEQKEVVFVGAFDVE